MHSNAHQLLCRCIWVCIHRGDTESGEGWEVRRRRRRRRLCNTWERFTRAHTCEAKSTLYACVCARDEGGMRRRDGRKMWIGRGWQSQQWRPARAFIIMIILDIPCPKQGQPASQPAKLSLLSFPILILFLPGRSGRHISRSGHKIHSPFPKPPIHLDCLSPPSTAGKSGTEKRRKRKRNRTGIVEERTTLVSVSLSPSFPRFCPLSRFASPRLRARFYY